MQHVELMEYLNVGFAKCIVLQEQYCVTWTGCDDSTHMCRDTMRRKKHSDGSSIGGE